MWHVIIAFGHNTRSNDVGSGMPSSPLRSTHGQRQAWHATIAFGQHKRSNDVGHGMPSSPLGSTNDRTMSSEECHHHRWTSSHSLTVSSLACHHRPWMENTVERRWAWHAIITFGKHRQSNDVRQGIPSSPLGSTHGRMTLGVACHHPLWVAHTVKRRRAWHAIIAFVKLNG